MSETGRVSSPEGEERPDADTADAIARGAACAGCWGGITSDDRVLIGAAWYCGYICHAEATGRARADV